MEDSESEEFEMITIMCEDIEFLINHVSLVTQGREEFIDNATNILSEMMEFYQVSHIFEHGKLSGKDGLYIIHQNNVLFLTMNETDNEINIILNQQPKNDKYVTIRIVRQIE